VEAASVDTARDGTVRAPPRWTPSRRCLPGAPGHAGAAQRGDHLRV